MFVTSEVDLEETYVQSQILYRIRIYRAVQTRQPALREPSITGVETLAELAGDERQYEAVLNGRAYNVIERVIALYPQESGEIEISPARFEARVLRDGRITGRKVFESQSHTINVLPIPAPPADFPDAAWLPARDVQLSEDWSRPPEEMEAGEPVTRHVTLSALGQIETQLPTLEPPEVDGLNVYADQPELTRTQEAGGLRGVRTDQYAIIGLAGGEIELPALAGALVGYRSGRMEGGEPAGTDTDYRGRAGSPGRRTGSLLWCRCRRDGCPGFRGGAGSHQHLATGDRSPGRTLAADTGGLVVVVTLSAEETVASLASPSRLPHTSNKVSC